jgi:hypothetical protein
MRNWWFQNIECGNILTYQEMLQEFMELYDGGDPTNPARWEDHYRYIGTLEIGC